MANVTLTDPLARAVTLHERTWFAHIVKGHPEMADYRRLVEQAIESPDKIRHSLSDSACRLYFGRGPRSAVMIVVVADVERGIVKTAHLARRPSGGDVEWSK